MPRGVSRLDEARLQGRLWTPALLPKKPLTWIDPSLSPLTISGGTISQINDLSGNGAHFTQATGAKQPTYTLNAIGGRPGMSFVMVNSQIITAPISITGTAAAVFHVAKFNGGASGNYGRFFSLANPVGFDYDNVNAFTVHQNGTLGNISITRNNSSASGVCPDNTAMLVAGVLDGSNKTVYVNTVSAGSNASTGSLNLPQVGIGGTTFGSDYSTHISGEFLVLDYAPAPRDQDKIEGHLAWRWGLVSSLPASHRFKNRPPLIGD